jgi:hypothetical protein
MTGLIVCGGALDSMERWEGNVGLTLQARPSWRRLITLALQVHQAASEASRFAGSVAMESRTALSLVHAASPDGLWDSMQMALCLALHDRCGTRDRQLEAALADAEVVLGIR